jgi:hypothetical protein
VCHTYHDYYTNKEKIFTTSDRLIDHGYHGSLRSPGYRQATDGVTVNRPKRASVEVLRRRLEAGEWLLPGEVGALFGKDRFAADNWIVAGKIGVRRTPGNVRECDPVDVRRLLDEYEQVRRGPATDTPDDSGPALEEQGQAGEQVGE